MRQSKHQFYDNENCEGRALVTFDFRRVDIKKVSKWPPEQKQKALKWYNKWVKNSFKLFSQEFIKELKK
jgi:hypothetical protein